ncbi:glucose-6-phosphate dehydrogenase [Lacticaseibacillus brantae]|uniref:Glucose-6-phosphate 1-dehydrogenase n=1 Tax=Lacticaseibacillus brantae DSM 23927 TaxID=1423727 RepID=A0A0R2B7B4_9LACO|nr:glucose-6-phosphate dehydrogenase [Lacticaseibacillus brantae]KRM71539.1 glucose-6-phosphate dehydrogenase [Lacticaseibacillus brantae DSM 23927]
MTEKKAVIILFGGSGDLAKRKLYPALFQLFVRGDLQEHFAVIGTARRPWSDEYYQEIVTAAVTNLPQATTKQVKAFASHFYYQSHDVTDSAHYVTLKTLAEKLDKQYDIGGNRIYYMAMAPEFFGVIAGHIKSENLLTPDGFNRLVIEKPFGHDHASAKELNDSISATFDENQIYRIDHYLGKEMVQGILALRFGNQILEPLWSKDYIDNIQITLAEAVGVEERAGYYESSGALRDMVQNHIMQLMAYLTMEKPDTFSPEVVHKVKDALFSSLHRYTPEEAAQNFIRAQYVSADVNGQTVNGYRQEDGVAEDSMTETFVAGKLLLDTPRWEGTPIYLRTGKRLTRKSTQVTVTFKPVANNIFATDGEPAAPNRLTIYVEPTQGYRLEINGKTLGQTFALSQESLDFRHDDASVAKAPEAYERLLLDVLRGDQTNFTRWAELDQSWQYVDVIRQAWDATKAMPTYAAGTMGPQASMDLLTDSGRDWAFKPTHIKLAD